MFPRNVLTEAMKCMKTDSQNIAEHVQKLLRDRSTYGDSPLHAALRYGQRSIVKHILMLMSTDKDCRMLVNGQNSSGKVNIFEIYLYAIEISIKRELNENICHCSTIILTGVIFYSLDAIALRCFTKSTRNYKSVAHAWSRPKSHR